MATNGNGRFATLVLADLLLYCHRQDIYIERERGGCREKVVGLEGEKEKDGGGREKKEVGLGEGGEREKGEERGEEVGLGRGREDTVGLGIIPWKLSCNQISKNRKL